MLSNDLASLPDERIGSHDETSITELVRPHAEATREHRRPQLPYPGGTSDEPALAWPQGTYYPTPITSYRHMERTTRQFALAGEREIDCGRCSHSATITHVVKVGNAFNCLPSADGDEEADDADAWRPVMSGWLCPTCFEARRRRRDCWEGEELTVPGSDD